MSPQLILPEYLIDVPGDAPRPGWGVRVADAVVTDVAPHADLRARYPGDEVMEAPRAVLAPGFVDAHTHLYGILAHGIPLDKAPSGFWPFLVDFWWPLVEDRLTPDLICAATDWNMAAMLRSGITSFYDCTEGPFAIPGCLAQQAEVVRRHGMRGILSFEATERVSKDNGQLGLRENRDFIRACKQAGGLISGLMCYHTTFTCSAEFIRQAFEWGEAEGVLVHAHVSEGTYEPAEAEAKWGVRPFAYYDRLGAANSRFLASQCVQLSREEIDIISSRGIRVTHMPLSNCEVGGGIAPVPDLLEAGVTVGLGSDGYITDFYEVMRGAFLIHKAHRQDPRVMPAHEVFRLATDGGAQAIGLDKVGRLASGWQADMQLVDARFPTPVTLANLYDQLVLYRSHQHVRHVWVAGQHRVIDGVVHGFDEDAARAATHAAARELWSKA